ncbi:transglycosylase domain-containing protein [Aureisphaera galaxeae]|uniref:penicillin-binding protein 1A n=1 Tax=Aureisphaera galaxeae TaxID=1538023 RepID=UPI002350BC4B|nr:transglycosylase domain-containing protein [Aureisphaera galaxeae]MDC8005023.1 transglycosylase domain-containing protein [Aureisphaera galaxeae]
MAKQASKKSVAKKKGPTPVRKHIKTFWMIFGSGVLLFFLLFLLVSWGIFGRLPDETSLENPEKDLATQIISEDGEVIGKFFKENRTPVQYEDLPEHLVNALIATEDVRFYDHAGIDGKGTVRAVAFLGTRGGASTITQQLAKQFFTGRVAKNIVERIVQKSQEWIIATRLERRYTKEEIITMYFNTYDFLNLAIGIESAANIYFNKAPQDLNVEESAMLVGMFKNSSLYNPRRNPEGVTNRRNVVLSQMAKYNYISENAKDSLQQLPLNVKFTPQDHDEGIGTYVREHIRRYMKQWAKENPKADGSLYDINSDGLKVYTTINANMQKYAEEAVDAHMRRLQKEFDKQNQKNKTAPFRDITKDEINTIMNAAMRRTDRWKEMEAQGKGEDEIIASFSKKTRMNIFSWKGDIDTLMTPMDSIRYYKNFFRASVLSMTPQTGEIKAWVGGINYKHFKYDMVKTGRRQIGSTFKPFVYATAIDQMHMSPCDTLPNTPYTIPAGKHGNMKDWSPKNSDGNYGGMMSLKRALASSVNTITARLIDRTGPSPIIDLVGKMGVDTKDVPEVPSIALGTPDITLYEMVGAYSTFANEGVYVEPILVQRIEDKNGTILFQNIPKTKDVISKETAYVTVNLMQGVTQGGSGSRLRHSFAKARSDYKSVITGYPYEFTNPIAGKTGTTQNNSDGWFMGMVPNLATGVWVGGEDRATHFGATRYGQGAAMALPIWGVYMKKCYADETLDVSTSSFKKPQKISIETDCEAYKSQGGGSTDEIPDDEIDF